MYLILFFIALNFFTFFSNAMTFFSKTFKHPVSIFETIPKDILNKIIFIDCANTYSSRDFSAEDFKAYVILKSMVTLNVNKKRYNFCINENFKEKCNKINNLLLIYMPLSLVNRHFYTRLHSYRKLIITHLTDKDIFLSGHQFNQRCQYIAKCEHHPQDLGYINPFIKFLNIKTPYMLNLGTFNKTILGHDITKKQVKKIPGIFKFYASMRTNDRMAYIHNDVFPVLICQIQVLVPDDRNNLPILLQQTKEKNYSDLFGQKLRSIMVNRVRKCDIDAEQFGHVESLFEFIAENVFIDQEQNKKKIIAIFNLCKYAYKHFNDYQYDNTPRQKIFIEGAPPANGFAVSLGTTLYFDLGPTAQQTIPLQLINNIVNPD